MIVKLTRYLLSSSWLKHMKQQSLWIYVLKQDQGSLHPFFMLILQIYCREHQTRKIYLWRLQRLSNHHPSLAILLKIKILLKNSLLLINPLNLCFFSDFESVLSFQLSHRVHKVRKRGQFSFCCYNYEVPFINYTLIDLRK